MKMSDPEPTKGKILCADDEAGIRSVLGEFLAASGYQVVLARDGNEAVAAFQQHREELVAVILDLRMPKMDGLQAAREIRKLSPDIPLIALSAFLGTHDNHYPLTLCDEAGFNAYMTKPFSAQPFLAALDEWVGRYKAGRSKSG